VRLRRGGRARPRSTMWSTAGGPAEGGAAGPRAGFRWGRRGSTGSRAACRPIATRSYGRFGTSSVVGHRVRPDQRESVRQRDRDLHQWRGRGASEVPIRWGLRGSALGGAHRPRHDDPGRVSRSGDSTPEHGSRRASGQRLSGGRGTIAGTGGPVTGRGHRPTGNDCGAPTGRERLRAPAGQERPRLLVGRERPRAPAGPEPVRRCPEGGRRPARRLGRASTVAVARR
jgi:hypothetical protein